MKIANANISLQSQHQQQNHHYITEDLRIRNGDQLSVKSQTLYYNEQNQFAESKVSLSEQAQKLLQEEKLQNKISNANNADNSNNANNPEQAKTLSRQPLQNNDADAIKKAFEEAQNNPKLLLIRAIIEAISGKAIKLATDTTNSNCKNTQVDFGIHTQNATPVGAIKATQASSDGSVKVIFEATQWEFSSSYQAGKIQTQTDSGNNNQVFGVKYRAIEAFSEKETTSFSANGIINTADGKQIQFQCDLTMQRRFSVVANKSEMIAANTDNAKNLFDPLVINFEGNAAELRNSTFAFDLNADGKAENIHELNSGSAFLVLDKNGDGKINNGNEMFGTQSGDGFADLAAYDEDGNGWIDENDSVYNLLGVWSNHTYGGQIRSLKQAGIGAIYLENVNTEFSIKEQKSNELQGQIRKTGIFVNEKDPQNISVGTIQHVDLAV